MIKNEPENLFAVLNIAPTADLKVIREAYSKMSAKYHPEENPEEWKKIHNAYKKLTEILKDEKSIEELTESIFSDITNASSDKEGSVSHGKTVWNPAESKKENAGNAYYHVKGAEAEELNKEADISIESFLSKDNYAFYKFWDDEEGSAPEEKAVEEIKPVDEIEPAEETEPDKEIEPADENEFDSEEDTAFWADILSIMPEEKEPVDKAEVDRKRKEQDDLEFFAGLVKKAYATDPWLPDKTVINLRSINEFMTHPLYHDMLRNGNFLPMFVEALRGRYIENNLKRALLEDIAMNILTISMMN